MASRFARKETLAEEITIGLRQEGMILTWYRDNPEGWRLTSGLWSPYYVNMRLLTTSPDLYTKVGRAFCIMLEEAGFGPSNCKTVGIAMAGIPIANAVTLMAGIPSLYTRKLPENIRTAEDLERYTSSHGQHALVEGNLKYR